MVTQTAEGRNDVGRGKETSLKGWCRSVIAKGIEHGVSPACVASRRGAVAADRRLSGEALQEGHPRQGVDVYHTSTYILTCG